MAFRAAFVSRLRPEKAGLNSVVPLFESRGKYAKVR